MNFAAQALATAAHDDVGKVAVPNVTIDRPLADSQSLCSFINRQKFLVIVRGLQFRFPRNEKPPPIVSVTALVAVTNQATFIKARPSAICPSSNPARAPKSNITRLSSCLVGVLHFEISMATAVTSSKITSLTWSPVSRPPG
jgi:hypothetical protein